MKSAEQILRENLHDYPEVLMDRTIQVMREYAKQCCEDVRNRCYDNAEANIEYDYQYPFAQIDKGSILNTEIVLP